eukprot:gene14873-biopygen9671
MSKAPGFCWCKRAPVSPGVPVSFPATQNPTSLPQCVLTVPTSFFHTTYCTSTSAATFTTTSVVGVRSDLRIWGRSDRPHNPPLRQDCLRECEHNDDFDADEKIHCAVSRALGAAAWAGGRGHDCH